MKSCKMPLSMRFIAAVIGVCLLAFEQAFGAEEEKKGKLMEVNRVLGLQVFADDGWKGEARELMRRLNAPYETTEVQGSTVYSSYAGLFCAGAQVYQTKVRAGENGVEEIEFVFANKGDSVTKGDKMKAQVRKFQQKLQEDAKTVRKKLSESFGKPKAHGDESEWTLKEAKIVLTVSRKEFMKLSVASLRAGEKQSQVTERHKVRSTIKEKKFTENVSKNDFGDVFIENVPMVNQGGKGYCGPATVERCLLYYGIEGYDMHELAEIFNTGQGGGTGISKIIVDTGKIVRKYGVELSREKKRLKGIRQAIDNGYPIFRHLFTDDEVEGRMNYVTKERQGQTAAAQWKKTLSKLPALKKAKQTNHFNLVVGYNEKTEEVGISDSWGNFARLRWIPWKDFENTTFELYVVRPK